MTVAPQPIFLRDFGRICICYHIIVAYTENHATICCDSTQILCPTRNVTSSSCRSLDDREEKRIIVIHPCRWREHRSSVIGTWRRKQLVSDGRLWDHPVRRIIRWFWSRLRRWLCWTPRCSGWWGSTAPGGGWARLWLRWRWRWCRVSLRFSSLVVGIRLLLVHHNYRVWIPRRWDCLRRWVSTILWQERDVPIVNVLGLSDTLGDLACRRCCEEVTDARESAVPLLNGIERSLVGTCDVVAANFPDVISKVKGSLHALQLALDSSPDAQQVIVCFHLCGPFVQHSRCHEHRLQMNDCGRPFKRQVISHRHPVL